MPGALGWVRPDAAGLVGRHRLAARAALVTAAAVVTSVLLAGVSANAATGQVHVGVAVNGQPAATSSDAHPAAIYPNKPTQVRIRVTNTGDSVVHVSTVRFEGKVLDLPLFSYDSVVQMTVDPGSTQAITIPVNMNGIGGLATGLIVATVTLIDPSGYAVGSQDIVTKVHGSLLSIYGLFALAVLALTVTSLVLALLMLVRHRLPQNRWLRAIRFFVPGFGIGLVLTFTLAASGLSAPGPGHWLALIAVPSAIGLAAGFLTPAPEEVEFDDYDEDVLLAEIVMVDEDPLEAQAAQAAQAPAAPGQRAATGAHADPSVTPPAPPPQTYADPRVTAGVGVPPAGAPVPGDAHAPGMAPTGVPDSRRTIGP